MVKKAVVLREAGGLGDVLQLGSTCDLLKNSDYHVSLYIMNDPELIALAAGFKNVDALHPVHVVNHMRRPRTVKRYRSYEYLNDFVEEAAHADVVVDAWCPAVRHEIQHARKGVCPTLSRAQLFAAEAGFDPSMVRPAEIDKTRMMAGNGGFADTIRGMYGDEWILVHLKAREPARAVPDEQANALIYLLAQKWTVVVFAYPEHQWGQMLQHDNVHWFTASQSQLNHIRSVYAAFALCEQAMAAVVVDSFLLHVSQSVGTPAVLLTGPTDPVPLTAHYSDVHWVERSMDKAPCGSCYYQANMGFSTACRDRGCFHLSRFSMSKLIAKVEEVVG